MMTAPLRLHNYNSYIIKNNAILEASIKPFQTISSINIVA